MNKPLAQSITVHFLVVIFIIISGWNIFSPKKTEITEQAVTVELLPIAQKTNVKPQQKEKQAEKEIKKEEKKPEPKKAEPKKPEPKLQEKPRPSDKPAPPKKEETKKDKITKKSEELDSLLKDLEKEKPTGKQNTKEQKAPEYDPNQPLSISELNYLQNLIMRQIRACWNVPAGARDAGTLAVSVDIDIARDGSIKFVGFEDEAIYHKNSFYKVAADAARRAVLDPRCNPLKELPPMEKYEKWHEITIEFDPSKLVY